MSSIPVKVSSGSYPVVVTSHDTGQLRRLLEKHLTSKRLFVFYDAQFYALHHKRLHNDLTVRGRKLIELVLPTGEKTKSLRELNKIYTFLLTQKISRDDFILAVGGGVTSDLVGYAAATTLRGIRWGVVPTTLLGMVDAAIGGKTGINHIAGKNLIGAFWHPEFVFVDTWWTNTLPERELIAGIGEVVKYAGLTGDPMLSMVEKWLRSDGHNQATLRKLVRHSVACKADIVTRDEREQNIRMHLNLGHTVGHAVEKAAGFGRLLHGEAVLLGLWAAVDLSCRIKPACESRLERFRFIIESFLPKLPMVNMNVEEIISCMTLDKKRAGLRLRFVLLDRPGLPLIADQVSGRMVRETIKRTLNVYNRLGGRDA